MPTLILALSICFIGLTIYSALQLYRSQKSRLVQQVLSSPVILRIAVPRNNDKSPLAAEQLFTALHGLGLQKPLSHTHFSLEIAAGSWGIHFICVIDKQYRTFVENQIYAQYPDVQIEVVTDFKEHILISGSPSIVTEYRLAKSSFIPIRTFSNFDVDPLAALTSAISKLAPGQEVYLQFLLRPLGKEWQLAAKSLSRSIAHSGGIEGESGHDLSRLAEQKSNKAGFQFLIRVLAKATDLPSATRLSSEVGAVFGQYQIATLNQFSSAVPKHSWWQSFSTWLIQSNYPTSPIQQFVHRFMSDNEAGVLNTEEVASLYHFPSSSVETPGIAWAKYKLLPPPLNLPTTSNSNQSLAHTNYRDTKLPYQLRPADRLRHTYIVGKTGTGKSTLMESMILQDIYAGEGVCVLDPHGEMVNRILERIPVHRTQDVIMFDTGDREWPISLNLLEVGPDEDIALVADGIISVFKKQWADSWGPRLEYILHNAILTLLHCQNVSLLVLPRLLTDSNYRKFILKQVKDPILMRFWEEEYNPMAQNKQKQQEEISSILNKVGRFTTSPLIRNVIGQVTSSLNLRQIMDGKQILLTDLSQGKIGEENMRLLGGMITTKIYSATMQRQRSEERTPFYLYIDEFQNFSTPTFVQILSEARKYGLGLTVAHQFIDQLDEQIRHAIFGNVGTLINFAVGPRDALQLSKEYAPYLDPEDLINLEQGKFFTKLCIDGSQSKPFSAMSKLVNFPSTGQAEKIREHTRKRYARHKEVITDKLHKWAEQEYDAQGKLIVKDSGKHSSANQLGQSSKPGSMHDPLPQASAKPDIDESDIRTGDDMLFGGRGGSDPLPKAVE